MRRCEKSNLVDCMTDRSAGFSPLRIFPAQMPMTLVVGFATSIAHQPTRDELTMPKMTNADLEAIVAYLRIRALA